MELSVIAAGLRKAADQTETTETTEMGATAADHADTQAVALTDRLAAASELLARLLAERRALAFQVETGTADPADLATLEETIRAAREAFGRLRLAASVARENKAAADQATVTAALAQRGRELLAAHGRFLEAVDRADAALDALAEALKAMAGEADSMAEAAGVGALAHAIKIRAQGAIPCEAAWRCRPHLGPVPDVPQSGRLANFFEQDARALGWSYNLTEEGRAQLQAILGASNATNEDDHA